MSRSPFSARRYPTARRACSYDLRKRVKVRRRASVAADSASVPCSRVPRAAVTFSASIAARLISSGLEDDFSDTFSQLSPR